MNQIIWLVGAVVIVLAILGYFGLGWHRGFLCRAAGKADMGLPS